MKTSYSYTYAVLRYVHDTTTGEFVNVGVILYAPQTRYLSAICRHTYARLSKVFPGVDPDHFKSLMHYIQARIVERGEQLSAELQLATTSSAIEIAQSVLPRDDSSLQWSPAGSGRTDDPAKTLEMLYERMVKRYDERQDHGGRSDDEVWRHFRRDLEVRQVLQHLKSKTISVQDDEIEFQHAWKNGKWHCLEPISFDLAAPDSIRDKAHRWLGQMDSIKDAGEPFKVYLLVGGPQDESLRPAFQRAVSILNKIPGEKEIVLEEDAARLADRIAGEVKVHQNA